MPFEYGSVRWFSSPFLVRSVSPAISILFLFTYYYNGIIMETICVFWRIHSIRVCAFCNRMTTKNDVGDVGGNERGLTQVEWTFFQFFFSASFMRQRTFNQSEEVVFYSSWRFPLSFGRGCDGRVGNTERRTLTLFHLIFFFYFFFLSDICLNIACVSYELLKTTANGSNIEARFGILVRICLRFSIPK